MFLYLFELPLVVADSPQLYHRFSGPREVLTHHSQNGRVHVERDVVQLDTVFGGRRGGQLELSVSKAVSLNEPDHVFPVGSLHSSRKELAVALPGEGRVDPIVAPFRVCGIRIPIEELACSK